MKNKNLNSFGNKAFTLIELLLVIAIIGLLVSIVAVGIKDRMEKARDARAKTNITQLRIEAAKIHQDYGEYAPAIFCCGEPPCKEEVEINCSEVETQIGTDPAIYASGNQYCVYVLLKNGLYFCLDNTGVVGEFSTVNNCIAPSYSCAP